MVSLIAMEVYAFSMPTVSVNVTGKMKKKKRVFMTQLQRRKNRGANVRPNHCYKLEHL